MVAKFPCQHDQENPLGDAALALPMRVLLVKIRHSLNESSMIPWNVLQTG